MSRERPPNSLAATALPYATWAFFIIILLWALLGEALARSPLAWPSSVGADNFQFDVKIHALERQIRQSGAPDCLIFGSSIANRAFDPAEIELIYTQKTGQTIHCFNFGLSSLTFESGGAIAEALVRRFQPKILIVVVSPRDLSSAYGDLTESLPASNWVRQQRGQPSLPGWMDSNVYGWRYALAARYWLQPANRQPYLREIVSIRPNGFSPIDGFRNPPKVFPVFANFTPDSAAWNGLISIARLPLPVIFVEGPTQPAYLQTYLETPEGYEKRFIQILEPALTAENRPLWRTWDTSHSIPDTLWHDSLHPNTNGAVITSRWLGEQLAKYHP